MKKQQLNEVKQLQKIAGILKETWHPDDPSSTEIDDTEEDPDDFDDISEEENSKGYYIFDLDEALVKLTDIASQTEFKQKVQQKAAQDPAFKEAFLASQREDRTFAKDATKYIDDQESIYEYTFDEWAQLVVDSHS